MFQTFDENRQVIPQFYKDVNDSVVLDQGFDGDFAIWQESS